MNRILHKFKTEIYEKCFFEISYFKKEIEGIEYDACQFKLNGANIICRSAKITPKKIGQFVTFWKRNKQAEKTQKWQLNYFYEIDKSTNLKRVMELYKIK